MLVYQRVILRNAIVVINHGLLGFTKSGISGMIQLNDPKLRLATGCWLLETLELGLQPDYWLHPVTFTATPCICWIKNHRLSFRDAMAVSNSKSIQIISIKFLSEPQYRRSFFQNNRVWVFSGAHDFQGWPGLLQQSNGSAPYPGTE